MRSFFLLPRSLCCIAILMTMMVCGPALSGEPRKILILPFTVNAEKDLSFLQKGVFDMLSSRLVREGEVAPMSREETQRLLGDVSGPLTEPQALALAGGIGADFVILGSLTVFGDSISTDARCVDVGGKSAVVTFNQAGKTQGDVITHVNAFARQINERVFGRRVEPVAASAASSPVPDSRRHPDKIWEDSRGGAYVYGAQAMEGQADFSVWKSRKFKDAILGVSVGDVDGDGQNEAVFINGSTVHVYRQAEGQLVKVQEIAEKRYNKLISIDVADINGNGTAEIYVTSLPVHSNTLGSYVLEWNGKAFQKIAKGDNRYYRVIDIPGRGKMLMGQERGIVNDSFGANELFSGTVFQLIWKNDRLEAGERQLLPRGVNIYGHTVGDLMNDGGEVVAAFTGRDFIRVTDRNGNEEWSSDERYGGSDRYLELMGEKQFKDERGDDESPMVTKVFLGQRLHIADMDGDGKNELIAVRNHDVTGQWLDQTRFYKSGHIECLAWDAIGMRLKWKTHKTGYISDYVLGDLNNDGTEELVFAVNLKSGPILGKTRSYIASLTLKDGKKDF